jgi:hypothetical protein
MEMILTVLVYGYFILGILTAALFLFVNPSYIAPVMMMGIITSSLVSQRLSCN